MAEDVLIPVEVVAGAVETIIDVAEGPVIVVAVVI